MRMSRGHIVVAAVFAIGAAAAAGAYLFAADRLFAVRGADPNDAAQVARGRQVYAENCAICHGDRLQARPTGGFASPTAGCRPRRTMRAVTLGIIPTSSCSR